MRLSFSDLLLLFHHCRDRADCENNFDELNLKPELDHPMPYTVFGRPTEVFRLKNQLGLGGYTTQNLKSYRLMARTIVLLYK
jgi:hypothetical protein